MANFLMPPARSEVQAAKDKLEAKRKKGQAVLGSEMGEAEQQATKELLKPSDQSAFELAEAEAKKRKVK